MIGYSDRSAGNAPSAMRIKVVRVLVIGAMVASVAACGDLAPQRLPLGAAGGADAFRMAEGDGPGGPWSFWIWTALCQPTGETVLYQWVEYAPLRGGYSLDLEQCHGGDSREQPYVVERSGVGDDGWAFIHGQTGLDVVRVRVRLVDGREFEAETVAAPRELDWTARFYVILLPVDLGRIDTVRGYDASGQDVGGDGA